MTKLIGKQKRIHISIHERIGAKANEVSKVWDIGFHTFDTDYDGTRTYRIVYFKNKNGRWYSDISIPIKGATPMCDSNG